MKQLLFSIAVISILSACNGNSGNNNVTPSRQYYAVPYWATDTLVGVWTTPTGVKGDTMYAFTQSSKSYIKYKGLNYEIKAYDLNPARPTGAAASTYFIDVFNSANTKINSSSIDCAASPYQYFDSSFHIWRTQPQQGMFNTPPFSPNVTGSLYSTLYK